MTLTIELPETALAHLEADAQAQGRPVAEVAGERLAALYSGRGKLEVDRLDADDVAAVERGLADMEAGRTQSLEDYEAAVAHRRASRNNAQVV